MAHMYEEVKRRPAFIVESILNRPDGPTGSGRPRPGDERAVENASREGGTVA
jgi:hypothetical protein